MYTTGTQFDFMSRLIALPVSGGDLTAFLSEGLSYAPVILPATKTQWNHVYAAKWAMMNPGSTGVSTYYVTPAF